MITLAVVAAVIFGGTILPYILWKIWTAKYSHLPQPNAMPWIGSVWSFSPHSHQLFLQAQDWTKENGYLLLVWLGPFPVVVTAEAKYTEAVLSSKTLIRKGFVYDFFQDWLGTGLLTSYGEKWKRRRRAITPTFHFGILNGFAKIFEEYAKILVEKLRVASEQCRPFDVQMPVSLAKLDVICETSMGVKVHAQDEPTSTYVEAINSLNFHIQMRQRSPWLWPKFLYRLTKRGKDFFEKLGIIHNFTLDVINKSISRRKVEKAQVEHSSDSCSVYGKKHKVFLDMLLDLYDNGEIDIDGIREEVDTFMFEGHDTTATALSWTLYELGKRPDIQEKLYIELRNADPNLGIVERVKSVKYLAHVIKEGLRLHPPVPLFGRTIDTDVVIDNQVLPKGTEIAIFTYMLHRNPSYWNDPDTFNPDRFDEKEFPKRNPYVYVPFSAGMRNCVGQKFAQLEEKIMLYYIILNFTFKSVQEEKEIQSCMDIIHKSENGLYLEFFPR